jgi:hypothetical protein
VIRPLPGVGDKSSHRFCWAKLREIRCIAEEAGFVIGLCVTGKPGFGFADVGSVFQSLRQALPSKRTTPECIAQADEKRGLSGVLKENL